jgi:protein-L-isoaspartate(D-aspartate) O-methyltransferase
MTDQPAMTALVDQLVRAGRLPDPAWQEAFAAIGRGQFVPYVFVPCVDRPGWRIVEGDEQWRALVGSDEALVTQLDGDDTAADACRRGDTVQADPTSSSSAPSLMAAMLYALDVRDGMRVLEVGAGTGYNAALCPTGSETQG